VTGRTLEIPVAQVFEPLLYPARYKGAHGGRGSGKSHNFAELWLDENIREPLDCVMLREVQKDLKFSVKRLLEGKIQHYNAGAYFEVQDRLIKSKAGGVTIFEGMQNHTAESIKSLERFKRGWFEEAQNASQKSLDILRPTFFRTPGTELWFSWNPDQPSDPIEQLLRPADGATPPETVVVAASFETNPWFPEDLRKEMEYDRARDPEKYAHVWLGGYQLRSETRVFKNWRVEEFDVDASAIKRQGADWGFAIDPSVLIQSYITGRTLYVAYEAYRVGCEIIDTPDLFDTVPESRKWPIIADSARPETISYMQQHGFPRMYAAVKGAGSIEEGVNFLQGFDIVVHPRCKHTIDELTMYSYKTDPLTGNVLPVLQDKKNNVIDALRYSHEGARKAKPARPVVKPQRPPAIQHNGFLAA
jgi:phage terminase large subunit